MRFSQKINDVETFTPYSVIKFCLSNCKETDSKDYITTFICKSLIFFIKENNTFISSAKNPKNPIEYEEEELIFVKSQNPIEKNMKE